MQIHTDVRFQSMIQRMEKLHLEGRTEQMRQLLEKLQTLAETEQDDIGLAAAYFYRDTLSERKPGDEAYMQYGERTLIISRAKNIPYYEMKASNSLGIRYSELSDFHTSLEHYLCALHISDEHPEFCYASIVLNNVGNLFVWLEEYTEAASYLERAYLKGAAENHDDRQLIAYIILNLIELYSNLEKYDKVREWSEKGTGILINEEQAVAECIELINEARRFAQSGQTAEAERNVRTFIQRAGDISEYIYILHCQINALRLGIELANFSLCADLMEEMEQLQGKAEMTSFAYNYATARVEYYQAFPEQLAQYASGFFQDYFILSQERIRQLRDTYAKSLSVKIALEDIKSENINVHLQNEQLQRGVERDLFTNLYNKVSTIKYVSAAMESRAEGEIQGLLLVDIDLFKLINDNYGHIFGDKVIATVAGVLETLDERQKIAGRFGGDEFLIFLGKQDSVEAIKQATDQMMERIRLCITLPDTRVWAITTSVGVCVIDSDITFDDAFMRADQALYRAKEQGRNQYKINK